MAYITKTDWVLNSIREEIISGIYKPGEKLMLKLLAQKYKVSEQPVREALKALQAERLVVTEPHVGTVVTKMDRNEIREIFEMRGLLEIYSLKAHLNDFDEEQIAQLRDLQARMKACLDANDPIEFSRSNRDFHTTLHIKSNVLLRDTLANCWRATRSYFSDDPARSRISYIEHEEILKAIIDKDIDRVESHMSAHVGKMIATAERVLSQSDEEI